MEECLRRAPLRISWSLAAAKSGLALLLGAAPSGLIVVVAPVLLLYVILYVILYVVVIVHRLGFSEETSLHAALQPHEEGNGRKRSFLEAGCVEAVCGGAMRWRECEKAGLAMFSSRKGSYM